MTEHTESAEQRARDLLERIGVSDAQGFTAGDLVELANLLAAADRAKELGAELKRNQRTYPLAVECLYTDDTKTLMSKGHQDPTEFMKACEEWYGGPLHGWGKVRHSWGRTVPDSTGEYKFLMLPAKPHARGAYPTTTVIDDPAYDHDDA